MRLRNSALQAANVRMTLVNANGSSSVPIKDGCIDIEDMDPQHENLANSLRVLVNSITEHTAIGGFEAQRLVHRLDGEIRFASLLNKLKEAAREYE